MLDKLQAIYEKYMHLEEQLSDPNVIGDLDRFKRVNKDYKELHPIVMAFHDYKKVSDETAQAREMLDDADFREIAKEELGILEPQKAELEEKIKMLLVPKDPEDSKDVLFEIRSGTGGDEASIFAGDLYRMYQRFFDTKGLKTELVDATEGTLGGYSKIILEVSGDDVYGLLKFESGAHRVQRVPETEAKGRVHTSAATVAVIPKLELEDVKVRREELRIDVFRSSGAGGQHVNRTESAVRIVHLPTGIVSECQEGRSQIQNREIAMQRLIQRITDAQRNSADAEQSAKRRSLVGTGDRSDKIRTYNFPQNRMTDHRINLTLYSLGKIMSGDIGDIIEALRVAENAEKLKTEDE